MLIRSAVKARLVLLVVCVVACDGGGEGFDPSSVTCTDTSIAAVIRLDFFSLEPKGYALFAGDGEPVTPAEAVAIGGGKILDESAEDGDVAVLWAAPGDFGSQAIVDLRTGTLVFKAGVVWMGTGEVITPLAWEGPEDMGHLSSSAPAPTAVDVVVNDHGPSGSTCSRYDAEEQIHYEVPCTTGMDALAVVHHTRLAHQIAACGEYRAAAVFWARTVGMTDLETAEWIVVLTGNAFEEAR